MSRPDVHLLGPSGVHAGISNLSATEHGLIRNEEAVRGVVIRYKDNNHQLDLIQRKYEAWKLWQREPGYDGPSRGFTGGHFCQTIANLKSQLGINTPPT